jgi:hypothetical protein
VTDAKERERLLKVATEYSSMLNAVADHQRLLLKYGWGVARSQRDEIERMVSRVGLRTPMPPEYMEFHEKQQRAEVDSVRQVHFLSRLVHLLVVVKFRPIPLLFLFRLQAREAALADGDLYVSEHVSPAAVAASTSLDDSPSSSPAGISNSAESEALVAPSAANSAAATAAAAESTRKLFRSSPKPAPSK